MLLFMRSMFMEKGQVVFIDLIKTQIFAYSTYWVKQTDELLITLLKVYEVFKLFSPVHFHVFSAT